MAIKRILLMLAASLIIAVIGAFIFYKELTALSYINTLFAISLIVFLLGLSMFISRSGFFDFITLSFRKFMASFSKQSKEYKNDLLEMALPSEIFSFPAMISFLITGALLVIITIFIGFLM